jgi:methionyl-tRNA formyltransferase
MMTDGDQRLGVWEAVARPAREGDPAAGELGLDGAVPVLGCSEGVLELTVVQPPGRRAMAGDAFLRGQRG